MLLLTYSSSLYPESYHRDPKLEKVDEQILPQHFRDASFRSFSDSQTLRPSYDVEYLYQKMRAPILPCQQQQSRFHLLPKLPPFDQLTPLDLDHPSICPPMRPNLQNLVDNTSQSNLLPPPLALSSMAPLPLRPNRTTSMGSHPPLSRSQTTRTVASSIYSRSVSTDELFSRHPSPLSSTSDAPHVALVSDSLRLETKSPIRPPTPHSQHRQLAIEHKPIRPESTPAMPPPSFWMYAHKVQEEHDPSQCEVMVPTKRHPFAHSEQRISISFSKNTESHNTQLEVGASANEDESPFYEKYRKGPRSPLWSGKSDFDRRLAAAISESNTSTNRSVHREKTNQGKVSKSRWPSTAF